MGINDFKFKYLNIIKNIKIKRACAVSKKNIGYKYHGPT